MDIMLLAHLNSSYDDWKRIFDEDAEARTPFVSGRTLATQVDENTAIIVMYGVDMEAMGAFLSTPEFIERTSPFVTGHTVYAISEMAPPA